MILIRLLKDRLDCQLREPAMNENKKPFNFGKK
jgi:hypothetical protein